MTTLKIGLGLRACHYETILKNKPPIAFFEALSDNYFAEETLNPLLKICEHYPITLHGVGLSLGSTDPLNKDYLKKLKKLADLTQPLLISDHLAWSSFENRYFHELLPLPYTEEAIQHVAERIRIVQDFLGQSIMIENVSSYMTFSHSQLTEWEFLENIAAQADCFILLDINNIYVSAHNNGFLAEDYLTALSPKRIKQFHLGGFEDQGTHLLDTHGAAVCEAVLALFKKALVSFGKKPTVIERDNNIPAFETLLKEALAVQQLMEQSDELS